MPANKIAWPVGTEAIKHELERRVCGILESYAYHTDSSKTRKKIHAEIDDCVGTIPAQLVDSSVTSNKTDLTRVDARGACMLRDGTRIEFATYISAARLQPLAQ
jgi:hypothetical protein